MATASSVSGATSTWNINGGSNSWTTGANWLPNTGFPNGNADVADLSQKNLTAATTITLDSAITVGTLLIGDTDKTGAGTYTIAAGTGGTLTFNNTGGAGNAKLTQTSQSLANTISANITLGTNLDVLNNGSLNNKLTISGNIALGGNTLNANSLSGDVSNPGIIFSNITGTGSLVKDGAGWARLSTAASNTFSITVNAGILDFNGSSMPTVGNIATLVTGTVNYNSSASATYAKAISGAGNLSKGSTGTLTLSGTNTYTGSTAVNAGKVIVSGSLTGTTAVTVSGGATLTVNGLIASTANPTVSGTLSGTGTVGGSATLTGGVIAPATTGSALTINGTVSLDAASKFIFTLGATKATNDSLKSGAITLASGATLQLLDPSIVGTSFANGDVVHLFASTAGAAPTFSGTFTNPLSLLPALSSGLQWSTADLYSLGQLDVISVPEPGTYAMLVGGLGMLTLLQRRRRG